MRGEAYPAADGLWPGAGALLCVITTTTGAEPEIVGKPFHPLFEAGRRDTIEGVIEELTCRSSRRRVSLSDLLRAAGR